MERISAVGLYLGIVGIIMQNKEANPAVAGYSVDDFVDRFSGFAFDLSVTTSPAWRRTNTEFPLADQRPLTPPSARTALMRSYDFSFSRQISSISSVSSSSFCVIFTVHGRV